jgi:hypothetical protein
MGSMTASVFLMIVPDEFLVAAVLHTPPESALCIFPLP